MMATFMKKLSNDKKNLYPTYSQQSGEISSSSNRRWQQEAQLKGKAVVTWCNRQRKHLVMFQHRGTDTAMIRTSNKLSCIEKSASSIISRHPHLHRTRHGEKSKNPQKLQQQELKHNNMNKNYDDDDASDIGDKEIYQNSQEQLHRQSLSVSAPVLSTIERDERKLAGSKVALFERAIELGWIKKVFRRHRASDESITEEVKSKETKAIILPADFPNESTMNICALVDPSHHSSTTRANKKIYNEKFQLEVIGEERKEDQSIRQKPHLPIYEIFNNLAATEEDMIEDPPGVIPDDFSAYCDKILFGRYVL